MTILQMPKNYYNDGGLRSHSISPWYPFLSLPSFVQVSHWHPTPFE